MRKPNLRKWQNTNELEGLLFFAQALEEMLFHYTIDSFKATALNTHTLAVDLRFLARNFASERIKAGTVIHVIEELIERGKSDPVIHGSIPSIAKVYFEALEQNKSNAQELLTTANALVAELDVFYWDEVRTRIKTAVANPHRKEDLIGLANIFITEAERQDYSRSYIHYITQEFFFNINAAPETINALEQIDDFLRFFNRGRAKWKVIFRGTKAFRYVSSHAENFAIKVFDEQPHEVPITSRTQRYLAYSQRYPLYVVADDVSSKDPYKARQHAERHVDILSDVYSFHTHKERLDWGKFCLVIDTEYQEAILLPPPPNPTKLGLQRTRTSVNAEITKTIEILIRGAHFVEPSRRAFFNALDYHRAAIEAATPEHQLLSLWAVLEGFLPPPTKDDARITRYVDKLLPSLTLTYPEKIFSYLSNSLYYAGNKVRDIVDSVSTNGSFFSKTVALLVTSDLKSTRLDLYANLENHPLLKFRCYQCHEQYKSNKKILDTIKSHRRKVGWHIQRIYATRNLIAHSAEALPYLRTLVENLHAYIDILLSCTIKIGVRSKHKIGISTALKLLSVHAQNYLTALEGEEVECTTDNYTGLIFGADNPISPFQQ